MFKQQIIGFFLIILISSASTQSVANELFDLGTHLINGLVNQNFDQCLPPSWLQAAGGANLESNNQIETSFKNSTPAALQEVLKFVGYAVDVVCLLKDSLTKLFSSDDAGKEVEVMTQAKSDLATAMALKSKLDKAVAVNTVIVTIAKSTASAKKTAAVKPNKIRRMLWWWDNVISSVESDVSSVVNKVESVAAPIVNKVESVAAPIVNKVESVAAPIVNKVESVAAPIVNKVESVASDIKNEASSIASKIENVASDVKDEAVKIFDETKDETVKLAEEALDKAKVALNAAEQAVIKAKNYVEKLASFIAGAIYGEFKKILGEVKGLISDIINFYHSPTVQRVITDIKNLQNNCAYKLGAGFIELMRVIVGFEAKVGEISTGVGVVPVAIELICNYSEFVTAIQAIINAITGSGMTRWAYIGTGIGTFIRAIGDA